MESGDEGGQLGLVDVLQFVDEQDEGGARARSRFTDRFQKCREVLFEVRVVCQPRFRVEIQSYLDVPEFHLQRLREPCQCSQSSLSGVLRLLEPAQTQQRDPELRCEHRWQGTALGGLNANGVHARRLRALTHRFQEHSLTHSPQADHQEALCGVPSSDALDRYPDCLQELVAARKLWRGRSSTGGIGIVDRIHAGDYSTVIKLIDVR